MKSGDSSERVEAARKDSVDLTLKLQQTALKLRVPIAKRSHLFAKSLTAALKVHGLCNKPCLQPFRLLGVIQGRDHLGECGASGLKQLEGARKFFVQPSKR